MRCAKASKSTFSTSASITVRPSRRRSRAARSRSSSITVSALQRSSSGQRFEVDPQHVGLYDLKPLTQAKPGGQIAIEFNHAEGLDALQQRQGHGAQARADLDQGLAWARVYGIDDGFDDVHISQEMLTEALAGYMLGHW